MHFPCCLLIAAAMGKQAMTDKTFETWIGKLHIWLRRQNSAKLPRYRAACKTERSLGQFLHKLQGAYKEGRISTDRLEILETIPEMQPRLQRWHICDSLRNKVKMDNTVRKEHKHFDHDFINGQDHNAPEDLQSRKELRIATRLDELHQWMVRNKMRLPSSVSAELQEQRQHNFLRKELYSHYRNGNLLPSIINHMRAIPEVQRLIVRWDKKHCGETWSHHSGKCKIWKWSERNADPSVGTTNKIKTIDQCKEAYSEEMNLPRPKRFLDLKIAVQC